MSVIRYSLGETGSAVFSYPVQSREAGLAVFSYPVQPRYRKDIWRFFGMAGSTIKLDVGNLRDICILSTIFLSVTSALEPRWLG